MIGPTKAVWYIICFEFSSSVFVDLLVNLTKSLIGNIVRLAISSRFRILTGLLEKLVIP